MDRYRDYSWHLECLYLSSFRRFHHGLLSDSIRVCTEIAVYCTVVPSLLPYSLKICLRKIYSISWKDQVPVYSAGAESFLIKAQLRLSGHVVHMDNNRISTPLFYDELVGR